MYSFRINKTTIDENGNQVKKEEIINVSEKAHSTYYAFLMGLTKTELHAHCIKIASKI
jgi:uncharacterized surface anchored protein